MFRKNTLVSLENLKQFICTKDENRIRHVLKTVSKQNSAVNMVMQPMLKHKPGKTRTHSSAPVFADTSRKAKKFKAKYYNCNKWGHCAFEYMQPKRGESSTPKPDNKANMVYQTAPADFVVMVSNVKTSTEWWLESSTACHVCNDSTLLEDDTAVKETVNVVNGGVVDVLKVRNATLVLSSAFLAMKKEASLEMLASQPLVDINTCRGFTNWAPVFLPQPVLDADRMVPMTTSQYVNLLSTKS